MEARGGGEDAPFAPCVSALRKSASECGGREVMCIGYEARCVQKRVPGVFSKPKEKLIHDIRM